jgi:hypothetical protein
MDSREGQQAQPTGRGIAGGVLERRRVILVPISSRQGHDANLAAAFADEGDVINRNARVAEGCG